MRDGLAGIVEVPEEDIGEEVRLLYSLANLKGEPTGALSMGALLTSPDEFVANQFAVSFPVSTREYMETYYAIDCWQSTSVGPPFNSSA